MNAVTRLLVRSGLRAWAHSTIKFGRFYQAMEKYGPKVAVGKLLSTYLPDHSSMECDLRDHVQRQIYFIGAYEPVESFLFNRLIRPGDTIVDAGANVGQYSLLAASKTGSTGSVHSFEPIPKNYARLARHVQMNRVSNIRLNQLALWNEPKELSFGMPPSKDANDGSYSAGSMADSSVPLVTARAVRFDEYAAEHEIDRVDLIKIDVEGAEWFALQGMAGVLSRHRPTILMEVNREACSSMGYDPSEFWKMLVHGLGYRAWRMGVSAEELRQLDSADGLEQSNVLFTRGDLPSEVASDWDVWTCLRWAKSGGRKRNS
jgi:FkbM family methyltransferase